ncbi:OmpA/MotB family protein [Aquiflexum gelatinilyticum]|uniref:OmpA family protein n=1 Tax=Aquiflexum gelatinilyticum TaxID=2961943 RepID=A0A9X2P6B3_9BACT|nr:OmpA family protein [Aquiflexum gelatinilyticum]MCR9013889.1 OmpA family protein [Aquiflexum gelatinilyticum]MCS4433412.1 OmpA family protein [Aquiflexum gelatinilyticum]
MKKIILLSLAVATLSVSCVSKKKYVELQNDKFQTEAALAETKLQKEALEAEKQVLEDKMGRIEARVAEYNNRINSLKDESDSKFTLDGKTPMSTNTKSKLNATLANVSAEELQGANNLEDSINVAISHNLKKSISDGTSEQDDDIQITVDKTVVMINVSDRLLFNTGSYQVSKNADGLLKKLAEVINSEPSLEVMIEGHTDPRTIQTGVLQDNWDLSVKRATSIVRILETKYNVAPEKLIAAGRASYIPLVENDSKENMAKNRRTRIVLIPDMDKFFAMIEN